jgi:hypothetical protein
MPPISYTPDTIRACILDAIYRAVDGLNEALPPNARLECSESEFVIGTNAKLDSLGLVTLMVGVESEILQSFGDCPGLIEELTDSSAVALTIGGLADFLERTIPWQA